MRIRPCAGLVRNKRLQMLKYGGAAAMANSSMFDELSMALGGDFADHSNEVPAVPAANHDIRSSADPIYHDRHQTHPAVR